MPLKLKRGRPLSVIPYTRKVRSEERGRASALERDTLGLA